MRAIMKRIHAHCLLYKYPVLHRSIGQTILAFSLYAAICTLIILCVQNNIYWASTLLTLPAAGLLVKLFTIQHDCGHGAYFKSKAANNFLGRAISIITWTPYAFWRDAHNRHHASSGNLSKRGIGAIDTLTLAEFNNLSPTHQRLYKLYRHPIVMVLIGPPLYIILIQRMPLKGPLPFSEIYQTIAGKHLGKSVMALNAAILVVYGALAVMLGLTTVIVTFLPILFLSACIGGWLFYVQHQYEDAYWAFHDKWDYRSAALLGSSHYDLPRPLHWLTGYIGFHHIHHLSSLIPNYRLAECHKASADLQKFPRMSMRDSLKTARLRFWDEAQNKMVCA